jgi:hypothetical protein
MPTFPVTINAIGSPEGAMTIPEFFFTYTSTLPGHLVRGLKERGMLSYGDDHLTFEAATRPAPFNLPPGVSKDITKKALGKEYPVVEIAFGGPPPAPAPNPLLKQGILNLGDKGINSRSNADVESKIAEFVTGKKGSIEQQKKQLGSRRRKGRKGTRRRRTTRRR